MSLPIVAIVGRPNVGKSSLFNRFLKKNLAVVDSAPGITRDRNYALCDWNGRSFRLIDTGGMIPNSRDQMDRLIYDQSEFAINEADVVLLVVDTHTGADYADEQLAKKLTRAKKASLLVANKADNELLNNDVYDFMKLGLGDAFPVSATVGLGIGELLDELVRKLPAEEPESDAADEAIRVAVVGRPNVGKSSFINRLLGQDRLIVSPVAGTTRDSVNTPIEVEGQKFALIDTAGLRRTYKVQENIEFYTTLRTIRAIEECDVAVILVDAVDGLTSQDQRVIAEVLDNRRAAVLAINKWDLVEKDSKTADGFTATLKDTLAQHAYLPILYISALSGQRVTKVLSVVKSVFGEFNRKIQTSDLNEFLQTVVGRRKPPAKQGKYIQLKYLTQTETRPPTFVFFSNQPRLIDKSYVSYLSNQLREQFGFEGVPLRLKFRRK